MEKDIPAFPSPNDVVCGDIMTHGHSGMTLRDYFAGMALSGILGNSQFERDRQKIDGEMSGDKQDMAIANICYSFADLMIAERDK